MVLRMELKESTCLFSFGVISDIQYADIDDRHNFSQTRRRYYRNALVLLREAVRHWNVGPHGTDLSFVMQLGDIIDGFNNEGGKQHSFRSLTKVLKELEKTNCTIHHVLGNHEFYNFSRAEVMSSQLFSAADFETTERDAKCSCTSNSVLSMESALPAPYYHFSPSAGFRCVVLDTYDLSTIGHNESCPIHQDSLRLLRTVNKNDCLNSPAGLRGADRRFVEFNGGLGENQMKWLEEVLQKASRSQEKVIIFGHTPFHPSIDPECRLWNYEELLQLLHSFSCVVAVFNGHVHCFYHHVDGKGIHVVTMPGIVEIVPGSNGFGKVEVFKDKLVLYGVGEVPSLEMLFPITS